MISIPFITLDVFTVERFRGNPLAVILDGRGLSDATMQAIAAEFGYSETTFVLPPTDTANTAQVRIFTPVMEIPFAGHPNVGTAIALAGQPTLFDRPLGDDLRFEEKAGLVTVQLSRDDNGLVNASIRAPQPLFVSGPVATADLASAMCLAESDIQTANHAPAFISVGLKFIAAELTDLVALGRSKPDLAALGRLVEIHADQETDGATFLYCRMSENHIRARMFSPFDNVAEDPATGSASAALAAYLAQQAPEADLDQTLVIEQGVEMGRRSLITITVQKAGGNVIRTEISGHAVTVMQGTLSIDR
ncbi:PhzF family phenazine biosynthesis protein [Agrobacterium vitis]|uniref:PhzF family phenazine biosynthesis protein n=1 Tax=Agrobacterium vitis TaxID=373 RepID=UPI003D2E24B4